jgi:hypothetical protein
MICVQGYEWVAVTRRVEAPTVYASENDDADDIERYMPLVLFKTRIRGYSNNWTFGDTIWRREAQLADDHAVISRGRSQVK